MCTTNALRSWQKWRKYPIFWRTRLIYLSLFAGSMQDFSYVYTNAFEITLEISCTKYPDANDLPDEWKLNKKSMMEYLKMVHVNIKGVVSDSNGNPVKDAQIIVVGLEGKPITSTERGEYWRLVLPGDHLVQVVANGWVFEWNSIHASWVVWKFVIFSKTEFYSIFSIYRYQSTSFQAVTVHPGQSTVLNFTLTAA